MKYKIIFIICMIAILAVFVVYKFASNTSQDNKITTQPLSQNSLTTQTNSEGSVIVKVKPQNISEDKETWQFQVILDTHKGSLDEDLTKSAELTDEKSNKQLPLSWDGDPPGGHHREGVFIFPAFQERPQSVTLILRNVGGIAERKFIWRMQ